MSQANPQHSGIRFKLLIFITLVMISLIPVAVLTVWVQHSAEQKEIDAVKDKHLIIAGSLSRAFQRYVSDVKSVFEYTSTALISGNLQPNTERLLNSLDISELCIVKGRGIYSNALNLGKKCTFKLDKTQFDKVSKQVNTVKAPVYLSNITMINSRPKFILGKRIAKDILVLGTLETGYVIRIQETVEFGNQGYSMVVDARGRVIAHPNSDWENIARDVSKISVVQQMISGETGISQFYSPAKKAEMIAAYTVVPEVGWGVMVPQSYAGLLAQAGDLRWAAILISVLGFTIAAVLAWIVARALAKPIESISRTAMEIASGNSQARVPDLFRLATREIQELAISFNRMVDRLSASHDDLQQHRDNLEVLVNERTVELRNEVVVREQIEAILQQQKERLDVTLNSIGDGVITTGDRNRVSFLNPAAEQLTGLNLKQVRGWGLDKVLNITDVKTGKALELLPKCKLDSISYACDGILHRVDQTTVDVQTNIAEITDSDDHVNGLVIIVRDVTETRKLSQQLSFEASHDALTGTLNRHAFEGYVVTAIAKVGEGDVTHCLGYLDLDQFKIVNDACGHAAGDELLCALTNVIQQCLRQDDTLARLGGDEFGIMFPDCSLEEALQLTECIRQEVKDFRFGYDDQVFHLGVSIGLVEISDSSSSLVDVFRAADSACYMAKARGRNSVQVYYPTDEDAVERSGEMRWVRRLQAALEEERFELHIQPIQAINKENAASHYEVLLRLRDEKNRLIFPGAFLPAAERYDLLPTIDRWVFSHAIEWLGENRQLLNGGRISINLTGVTICEESFLEFADQQFERFGHCAESMIIEITENSALNNLPAALRFICKLKAMGCQFALDDFGKGFSSLSSLKHLPVDYIKIDGGFVRDILVDTMDETIVKTINTIGQAMEKGVIAEFVESEEIFERLQSLHIDYGQGYYIARPCPLHEFTEQINQVKDLSGCEEEMVASN